MTALRASAARNYGDARIQVDRIHFVGVARTKSDALLIESKHLFSQKTFRDLVVSAYETKRHMEKVGLFNQLDVFITPSTTKKSAESTNSNNFEVQYFVREPTPKATINGNVNNRGEAGVGAEGSLGTVFGRGEVLSTEASFGHKHTSAFNLSFIKPLLKLRDATIGLQAFRAFSDHPWTGGVSQLENGLSANFRWEIGGGLDSRLVHELRYVGSWRRTECSSRTVPFVVREHSGHSLKSSLINSLKYSTLDSGVLPTRGVSAAISQEIAGGGGGLGGDARFVRHDADFRAAAKLPPILGGFILAMSANAAYVDPRSGTLNVLDRLFLGGPTTLRGFAHQSVGPAVERGVYVGGVGSVCAAVHLYRPLFPKRIVFAHAFATGGSVCPLLVGTDRGYHGFGDVIRRLISDQPRCSLGVGLAFKLGEIARLELNYCWPFTSHPMDATQPGFQFGIGVSFL